MEIEYRENTLTADDFREMRISVGWFDPHPVLAERSVKGTIYSACAYSGGKIIRMIRLIGDGGISLYIQDLIVKPGYQRQGTGTRLMGYVMDRIRSSAPQGSVLTVGFMAAKGAEGFYERFGFHVRPNDRRGPGMQQMISINTENIQTDL